ncbi:MAG: isoprenylcysteine carboxylmethyltransferase family protein [Gemmatimonadaceae bacterium]
MILRQLLSVFILPFTVTVLIPLWLARRDGVRLGLGTSGLEVTGQGVGGLLLLIGLALFVSSLRRFATEGEGTLAPWDPPRKLVVRGPYRYVRNPMISGVVLVLFAESLLLRSMPHASWALTFLAINAVYIPLLEEPLLHARFGAAYENYRQHVPRLVPRLTPWAGTDGSSTAD